MSTIPNLSEQLNNEYIETWFNVQAEASDNILDARVVTALLKEKGVFQPQVGERFIERTVKYGKKTASGFVKGDVLPLGDPETETVALWDFAHVQANLTRSFIEDRQNQGRFKRKDYIIRKLEEAKESLADNMEDTFMREAIFDSTLTNGTEKLPFSLFDYVPDLSVVDYRDGTNANGRTFGGINRGDPNSWWQHQDFTAVAGGDSKKNGIWNGPNALTLYEDMKHSYNTTGAQLKNPDMIITTQELFETYDDFVSAKEQVIREDSTNMANLGYDVLQFRGKPIVWSEAMTPNQMLMLNSSTMNVVFDPTAWFMMTSWERPARQLEQVAYIINSFQFVGWNPRFNARLKWAG